MKRLTFLFAFVLGWSSYSMGQSALLPTGGEASGSGGTASYSVGQTFYTSKGSNTTTDGVQQPYEFYTSVEKVQGIELTMTAFPNPTQAQINLQIEDQNLLNDLSCQLLDISGKIILNKVVVDERTTVPMENLPSGTYLLSVRHENTLVKTFKIIKND